MPRLRLHLKVLAEPTLGVKTIVDATTRAYAQAGVGVEVATQEALTKHNLDFVNITKQCKPPGPLTKDQQCLFDLAKGIGSTEIVIFFVEQTSNASVNGCAQHPKDIAGAVVAQACTIWTMAHEIGHLLGLIHVHTSTHLMCNTKRIKGDPAKLDAGEIAIILKSSLVSNS
jgi:hypothetical protein